MNNEFPLNEDDFDEAAIAFEMMAGLMAKQYKAFVQADLSVQEAAALTAAYWSQMMPQPLGGPQDGS